MQAFIQTEEQLKEAVAEAVAEIFEKKLPTILRKAKRSEYLTTKELKNLTGWSYRSQKNLRDTNQLTYSQHGRKIVYPTKAVEEFLRSHEIKSKEESQND